MTTVKDYIECPRCGAKKIRADIPMCSECESGAVANAYLIVGQSGQRVWLYDREPTPEEALRHQEQGELCAGPEWCSALVRVIDTLGGRVVSMRKTGGAT